MNCEKFKYVNKLHFSELLPFTGKLYLACRQRSKLSCIFFIANVSLSYRDIASSEANDSKPVSGRICRQPVPASSPLIKFTATHLILVGDREWRVPECMRAACQAKIRQTSASRIITYRPRASPAGITGTAEQKSPGPDAGYLLGDFCDWDKNWIIYFAYYDCRQPARPVARVRRQGDYFCNHTGIDC